MQALPDTTPSPHPDTDVPSARRALAAVPDRAAREAAAALARQAYCARLKASRERRGISLEAIAEKTKVSASLFAALERNDVSRWPTGIYRRAFFREYINAVGVPVEPSLSEFLQLFPDDYEQRAQAVAPVSSGPLRLTLAGTPWRVSLVQIVAAVVDIGLVAAIASVVAWLIPVGLGTVTGVVALIYYALATAFLTRSPASWWLRTLASRKRARRGLRLAR
jgi:transcriptional regulator with XRE-family HTH domain